MEAEELTAQLGDSLVQTLVTVAVAASSRSVLVVNAHNILFFSKLALPIVALAAVTVVTRVPRATIPSAWPTIVCPRACS